MCTFTTVILLFTIEIIKFGCFNLFTHAINDKDQSSSCRQRWLATDRMVCVCDSKHPCASVPRVTTQRANDIFVVRSGQNGDRFKVGRSVWNSTTAKLSRSRNRTQFFVHIDTNSPRQRVFGFGGTFTDAGGINFAKLNTKLKKMLIDSYFNESIGLAFTYARATIGPSDSAVRMYSYDDWEGDFMMQNFSLVKEDTDGKIPFLLAANSVTSNGLRVYASAWSAPVWMKNDRRSAAFASHIVGEPGGKYYKAYARYLVKYLEAYGRHGVKFWRVSVLNEPTICAFQRPVWPCTWMSPYQMRDFIKFDLGPELRKSNASKNLPVLMLDDQRLFMLPYVERILLDSMAARFVSGVALHWYTDETQEAPTELLDQMHRRHPTQFMMETEATTGLGQNHSELGSWSPSAQLIATRIIDNMNHWVNGWQYYNLLLDLDGGPTVFYKGLASPMLLNETSMELLQLPEYHAIGHFSAYMRPGCVVVPSHSTNAYVKTLAAKCPADSSNHTSTMIVLLNTWKFHLNVHLSSSDRSNLTARIDCPSFSISTAVWRDRIF